MAKIQNDKYYTPIEIANKCIDRVIEIIGLNNISQVIEPSCGDGSFFHHEMLKPDIGFDIEPEIEGETIYKKDFLLTNIPYKKGRLVIGNPPYGSRMNLSQKFFNQSIVISDYIAFILPISQLNNIQSLYQFDLIYSEDLGKDIIYTDRKLHCCFNIYKRPEKGLNPKPSNKLQWLKITRQDAKNYNEITDYDIRFCYWGDGTAGKILTDDDKQYAGEYKIKISDECPFKEEVINYIKTFNWKEYIKGIAMRRIKQFHIIEVVKHKFKGIK